MSEPLKKFQRFWWRIGQVIFPKLAPNEQSLYQKLNIIFGFFFLVPTFGLLYFLITYDLLSDQYIPHFFGLFLLCSLSGFVTLRMVFEKIANMSNKFTQTLEKEFESNGIRKGADEVENISKSFTLFEKKLTQTCSQLEKKFLKSPFSRSCPTFVMSPLTRKNCSTLPWSGGFALPTPT